ncbi:MAG TPA: hypothetical protein DCZ92_03570 [Elusimicrobia bacterium]|nr:hypothetical protein [Elusimicrobiota bacterium]HBB65956.1 hypothetical protein [Elusimicrobiota bacterium]
MKRMKYTVYSRRGIGFGCGGGIILACLITLAAGPVLADTSIDSARQLMGRTTYPAKAWAVSTELDYNLNNIRDEGRDTAAQELNLNYGLTDAWSAGVGIESGEGPRKSFIYDRLAFGTRYQVLQRPFQLAPFVEYLPSLRQGADEWKLGLEALKNRGNMFFQFVGYGKSHKEPGSARELKGMFHLGPYYRFGTSAMAGVMLGYQTDGVSSLHLHYTGALGKYVFLGVEPKFGLSRRAPDLSVDFLLGVYFGPYGLLDWILE